MGHISHGVVIVKDMTHLTSMTFVTAFLVKKGAENCLQAILTWAAPYSSGLAKISLGREFGSGPVSHKDTKYTKLTG